MAIGGCGNQAVADSTAPDSSILSARVGDHVMLARSSKTDPYYWVFSVRKADGTADTLTYEWGFGDGQIRAGKNVSYTYTRNGDETVTVKGIDGDVVAVRLSLDIVVAGPNRPPVANVGNYIVVEEGTPVVLDGTASTDADGDPLTFEWRQTSGPAAELSDPSAVAPSFVAPLVAQHTMLVFGARVSDGQAASEDNVGVVVKNVVLPGGPVARAGADVQVVEGDAVQLDGSASVGSGLSFAWTQTAGPLVLLHHANTARPIFDAPGVMSGADVQFVFQLVVAAAGVSSADTVRVKVQSDGGMSPIAQCNIDWDGDGVVNCDDGCPQDAQKMSAGACGCGVAETDGDRDGTADCRDLCPLDATKTMPGVCGCDVSDDDPTCGRCVTGTAAWTNRSFLPQSGHFTVNFSATPRLGAMDALVGLSNGAGLADSQFAAMVRFSPDGVIRVRDGDVYASDAALRYAAGMTYYFSLQVDVAARTFSVYVTPEGGEERTLATVYAFRGGQGNVGTLNNWGVRSSRGSLEVCEFAVAGIPLTAMAGPDVTVAPGTPVVLAGMAVGGVPPYEYLWAPATGLNSSTVAQPTASVTQTTTYVLRVTDTLHATATDTVVVTIAALPLKVSAGADVSIQAGASAPLLGSAVGGVGPYTYQWTPSTGLSNATAAQPIASPTQTTTYTLTAKDSQNRTATDAVTVNVGSGRVYYVAKGAANADDTNPGTESAPWKTLTKAGTAAKAGDTVVVKAGTYNEALRVQNLGSAGAMITFKASPACIQSADPYQAPNCDVTISGAGIDINRKSYIRVEGFEVTNHSDAGIWCQTRSEELVHHVELVNNYIHDLHGYGIECRNAHDTLIENNYIRNIHSSAGIGIRGDREERNITVRGNKVLHVDCDGIHIEGQNIIIEGNLLGDSYHTDCHQDALEVYGPVDGLTIRNNLIWDWTQNIYLSAETSYVRNVAVLGNVVWCDRYCAAGNDAPGVNAGPNVADLTNLRIEGNTFHNVWNLITDGYARSAGDWVTGLQVRNNVFASSKLSIEINGSFVSDYNLFYQSRIRSHTTLADYRAAYPGSEAHSVESDPMFVNTGAFDFHLRTDSPAIDKGTMIQGLPSDPDGRVRHQGSSFDLGAYEVR
jgi:hypothetical protein